MNPTLYAGDKILTDTRFYAHHPLQDGDVIVFRHHDTVLVKRITALPGEIIGDRKGFLVRNGQPLREAYVIPTSDPAVTFGETFDPKKIPGGEIFVTGDNRGKSLDSRFEEYGPVYVKDVVGKVTYAYGPHHGDRGGSL